jgi:hypothetical protein
MGHGISIWRYGFFEFSFLDDFLYQIWCDSFDESIFSRLNAGEKINLKKWMFNKYKNMDIRRIFNKLNEKKISFTVIYNEKLNNLRRGDMVVIRVLKSNVELYFEEPEDFNSKKSFYLGAIGLSYKED